MGSPIVGLPLFADGTHVSKDVRKLGPTVAQECGALGRGDIAVVRYEESAERAV